MTEQKPPGMSWETWIDQQIREAREAGLFDNLPGAGKPLASLAEGYDPLWWVKQLVQREKISVLPPSLELLRKVESEMAAIWQLADEAKVRSRILALNREIGKVNARSTEGPPTRLGPLDVEAIVADWRARQAVPPGPAARVASGCSTPIAQPTSRRSPSHPASPVRAWSWSPCAECRSRNAAAGSAGTTGGGDTSGRTRPSGRRNWSAPSGMRSTW